MTTWNIYIRDREAARVAGDPLLGTVEAETKEDAESIAMVQGLGMPHMAGVWAVPMVPPPAPVDGVIRPPPDNRPVGDLTIAELARALGVEDLELTRLNAEHAKKLQEKMVREAQGLLGDVDSLRAIALPSRLGSPREITSTLEHIKAVLEQHPDLECVLVYGFRSKVSTPPHRKAN